MNFFRNAREVQAVAAGTVICRKGDLGDVMYAIVEGYVEVATPNEVLNTLGPGEFFGEMALIDRSPRSATARAKTDCRLAILNEKQFLYMVQTYPLFALEMMRVLAVRLRERL
jgi:CRP-like cAMP-binding protein